MSCRRCSASWRCASIAITGCIAFGPRRGGLAQLDATDRAILDRYVAGVNDGRSALTTRPFEYAVLGLTPQPWQAVDTVLAAFAMYFDLQGNLAGRELARGWIRERTTAEQLAFLLPGASRWDAPLDAAEIPEPPIAIP